MHIFKYSKRAGTKAAEMPLQIPEEQKTARSAKLIALEQRMSEEFREYYVGTETTALMEETAVIGGKTYFVGFTKEYVKVAYETTEDLTNRFHTGIVKGCLDGAVYEIS